MRCDICRIHCDFSKRSHRDTQFHKSRIPRYNSWDAGSPRAVVHTESNTFEPTSCDRRDTSATRRARACIGADNGERSRSAYSYASFSICSPALISPRPTRAARANGGCPLSKEWRSRFTRTLYFVTRRRCTLHIAPRDGFAHANNTRLLRLAASLAQGDAGVINRAAVRSARYLLTKPRCVYVIFVMRNLSRFRRRKPAISRRTKRASVRTEKCSYNRSEDYVDTRNRLSWRNDWETLRYRVCFVFNQCR